MYNKRIKIFIIVSVGLLLVCLLRLIEMQLFSGSYYLEKITELKRQRSHARQLKTVRGTILDRNNRVIAVDEPRFYLHISYNLSSFMDQRLWQAKRLIAAGKEDPDSSLLMVDKELKAGLEVLQQVIDKCAHFGIERSLIEKKIEKINDSIWNLRTHFAWKWNFPQQDFAIAEPDPNERLLLAYKVNLAEMHKSKPLLELKTDDDVFAAQLEFSDIEGVVILPEGHRVYPFASVAAQTIGWVGPEQEKKLFADDRLSSYLTDDVSGRRPGVEYVCEAVLRGRRGEIVYDIDRQLVEKTKTEFGNNVQLTLDIELQRTIENYLADFDYDPNCGPGVSVVVIDVVTGDILAMVSMPTFDLNRIRYDYDAIINDPNRPLTNRAIYALYAPGSVIKPTILIAGLESGAISEEEIIPCPAKKAPKHWPSCWTIKSWYGHNDKWQNYARNAIKGSCNIYFSRLADKINPSILQQWLFKFGYGHKAPLTSDNFLQATHNRNLLQAQGVVSNTNPAETISQVTDLPPLKKSERRWFGMGQGNLRVTPLQVANATAVLARGGLYLPPNIFIEEDGAKHIPTDLNISKHTLDIVCDGLRAVVNESGGTANTAFAPALDDFAEYGVKVHGKTGSTQAPENAWFAGFAEDGRSRSISIAIVVEGGQSGQRHAAPLARDILTLCVDAGYIGNKQENQN